MEGFPYQEEKRLCLVQIVGLWLGESRDKESLECRLTVVCFYLNLLLVEKVYLEHLKSSRLTVQVVFYRNTLVAAEQRWKEVRL